MDTSADECRSSYYIEIEPIIMPLKRWNKSTFVNGVQYLDEQTVVDSMKYMNLKPWTDMEDLSELIGAQSESDITDEQSVLPSFSQSKDSRIMESLNNLTGTPSELEDFIIQERDISSFYQSDDSTTVVNSNDLTGTQSELEYIKGEQSVLYSFSQSDDSTINGSCNSPQLLPKCRSCDMEGSLETSTEVESSEQIMLETESTTFIEIETITLPPTYAEATESRENVGTPEDTTLRQSETTNSLNENSSSDLYVPPLSPDFFLKQRALYHLERCQLTFTPKLEMIEEDKILEIIHNYFKHDSFEINESSKNIPVYMKKKFRKMKNFFKVKIFKCFRRSYLK